MQLNHRYTDRTGQSAADIGAKAWSRWLSAKDTEPDELIELLRQASFLVRKLTAASPKYLREREAPDVFDSLTDRESQILAEVAKGYRNKQIADHLFISSDKRYMKSLLKKLRGLRAPQQQCFILERYGELR